MKNKGITLIALVVTIIILLILAGVTVGMATSGTGLFDKAKQAVEKYQNAQEDEEKEIEKISNEIDNFVTGARDVNIETREVSTTNGKYEFNKLGKIVYCFFYDKGINIKDYTNKTTGILLESLPFTIDRTKCPSTPTGWDFGGYTNTEGCSYLSSVYSFNTVSSAMLRVLDDGKLQIFYTQYDSAEDSRSIAGTFYYFTTD